MADFSYSELLQDLGNNAAEFGKYVVNKSANHVCALYAQYPGFFVGPIGGEIQRGLYNNLCAGRPSGLPPAPPPPSFVGGQCPSEYDVTVQFNVGAQVFARTARVVGPVYFGGMIDRGVYDNFGRWGIVVKAADGPGGGGAVFPDSGGQYWARLDGSNVQNNPYSNAQVTSVVVVGGQPNNCGNPPSGYPSVSSLPNGGAGTVDGTHANGGVYVIPVLLKPSLIGEVNIDVGGVNVKFDMSGAKLGGGGADLTPVLDAVNEGVAQILDGQCACADIPDEDSYDTEAIPDEDGTSHDELEGLEWVRITITSATSNAKSQSGGGASDVFFAGWFAFLANGAGLPREPIHFIESIFKAPEGCTGYEYCLYQGYRGTAVEYLRPVTPPVV